MPDFALTLSDVCGRGVGPLSLALLPGEIAGVVGPAGAGKTRLLRLAGGLARRTAGDVRVCGMSPADLTVRQLIGYGSDHPAFPRSLTVEEVLLYCARLHCAQGNGGGRSPPRPARGGPGSAGPAPA